MRLLANGTRNSPAAAAVILLLSPTLTYAKAKAKARRKPLLRPRLPRRWT